MRIVIHKDNDEIIDIEPSDPNLLTFLQSESNVKDVFEHILTLGYSMLSIPIHCKYSFDPITNGFQEMKDSFSEIHDKLEPIQTNGTSAKIGKLAELLAQRNFIKSFPSFTYNNVAGTDKSGDAIINTHLSIGHVMIEYKNYNTSVCQQEVDKLYRDMENKGINYALFMSFKSPISNKQGFEYEVRGDKTVVFVACGGYDGICIEIAMRFLLHLHDVNIVSIYDKAYEIATKVKHAEFITFYESLFHLSSKMSQLTTTIQESRDTMNKTFDKMMREGVRIESDMYQLVSKVKELSDTLSIGSNGIHKSYEEIIHVLDDKIPNKTNNLLMKRFMNLIHKMDIHGKINNSLLFFYKDDISICKIDLSKTKLEVSFDRSDDIISYNPTYESYKHNRYYVHIKENDEIWKIILSRIQNLIIV